LLGGFLFWVIDFLGHRLFVIFKLGARFALPSSDSTTLRSLINVFTQIFIG
jgi:hypothetical protein